MFSSIKNYLILLLISSALGYVGYLRYDINSLEGVITERDLTIESLTSANKSLKDTIESKELAIDNWRFVYNEQLQYREALQSDLDQLTGTIDRYKSRQDIVFQKPGLVQIKEQKALDKFFNEVRDAK